jgi:uncharacterized membrane protein
VVLGTFIATFLFALVVLQTVTEGEPEPFVPHLSVTVALVLTLVNLAWLVGDVREFVSGAGGGTPSRS